MLAVGMPSCGKEGVSEGVQRVRRKRRESKNIVRCYVARNTSGAVDVIPKL